MIAFFLSRSDGNLVKELLVDIQGTPKTLVIKLNAKRCFNHTDECDSKYIVSCHVFDFQS